MSDELIADILRRLTELEAKVQALEAARTPDLDQIAYRIAGLMRHHPQRDDANSATPHQVTVVATDSLL